jgi:hypothetical protein
MNEALLIVVIILGAVLLASGICLLYKGTQKVHEKCVQCGCGCPTCKCYEGKGCDCCKGCKAVCNK